MIIVVSYVQLSIVFKLKFFNIKVSLSISSGIGYHRRSQCANRMHCNYCN